MTPLRVFIGYDPRESVAYHVASHSILRRASVPVSITPIARSQLQKCFGPLRPCADNESTDFSWTRFFTPALAGYEGWAVFMDCDVLVLEDIAELFTYADDKYAVMTVKHDMKGGPDRKFLGAKQELYPRKNWSSVMLINCRKWRDRITPTFVRIANPAFLHRFESFSDEEIGELPANWNYLVGYDNPQIYPKKIIHYTLGGPWFKQYSDCDFAMQWFAEYYDMTKPKTSLEEKTD